MARINCCRECVPPKRHIGCHGTCPEYIKANAKNEEKKLLLAKQRNEQEIYLSYHRQVINKANKRSNRK